jgi:ABC-2 type transport system permease protein
MARLLVELKLRMLGNAMRSSTAARTSFIISTIGAALVAIATFWVLAQLRVVAASVDLTTVIFSIFAIGWLLCPIFAFGLDGTLDPATMALYPLRTRPLVTGLLAASAVGAWPAANVLGLLGVTVGLAHGGLGVLVAFIAVVLQVLFCIVLARFAITSLARLLRSRRGKDLAIFLIIPVGITLELLIQVLPRAAASGSLSPASFAGVDSWLRWLPPGLAAHAIQDASTGHLGDALMRLVLLVAVIAVLGVLWVRTLAQALVTADTTTGSSRVRNAALPLARYGLRGAVAARFLKYQHRDPASLANWPIAVAVMFICSASTIVGPHQHPGVVIASAVFGAAFAGGYRANPVGQAGPAFVLEATALRGRRELRAYFSGQDIVYGVIAIPLLVGVSIVLGVLVGDLTEGFTAAAVSVAGLGAALAMGNIFSVVLAYPMQKRAGNPMPQPAQGYTAHAAGAVFGALASVAVAVIPIIILGNVTSGVSAVVRLPVLFGCASAYGFCLAWLGVRAAAVLAEGKLPELCQIAMRTSL